MQILARRSLTPNGNARRTLATGPLLPMEMSIWGASRRQKCAFPKFQKSQNDINKVLDLEKRHFGALAGQGLVNIELKNYGSK